MGHFNALGAEAHGDVQVNLGGTPSWQGKLSAYSPDLSRSLRLAGYSVSVPPPGTKLEMDAAFKGEAASWIFPASAPSWTRACLPAVWGWTGGRPSA